MHGNGCGSVACQSLVKLGGELVDAQFRGVDHDVGTFLEVLEQSPLFVDAVDKTVTLLQRVRPADGFESLDQYVVIGI